MHVETMFVRALNTIFARNRLLRSARADRGETSFFAVRPGVGAELVGYEDSRTRFLGEGSLVTPTGCEPGAGASSTTRASSGRSIPPRASPSK